MTEVTGIMFNGPNNNDTAEHTNENGYIVGNLIYAENMNDDMRSIQTDLSKIYGILLGTQIINSNPHSNVVFTDTKINWSRIKNVSIGTNDIQNNAVTTNKIANNSVTSAKIADGTIVNADINANAAIAYTKLNLNNSIQTSDIVNKSITTEKINDSAVDTTQLKDNAVTSTKIDDNTIVDANINVNAAIAKSKLALTGEIKNGDIASDAAIAKSKLALTGMITKTDLADLSNVTNENKIPLNYIDTSTLGNSGIADISAGILKGKTSTGTARNYYGVTAITTDRGKILGTDSSDGSLRPTGINTADLTALMNNKVTVTANSNAIKLPTWNTSGFITGDRGTLYSKTVRINGVSTSILTSSNSNDLNNVLLCAPTTNGTAGQYLRSYGNGKVYWDNLSYTAPLAQKTVSINTYNVTFNATSALPNTMYIPTNVSAGKILTGNATGTGFTWKSLSDLFTASNMSIKTINIGSKVIMCYGNGDNGISTDGGPVRIGRVTSSGVKTVTIPCQYGSGARMFSGNESAASISYVNNHNYPIVGIITGQSNDPYTFVEVIDPIINIEPTTPNTTNYIIPAVKIYVCGTRRYPEENYGTSFWLTLHTLDTTLEVL